ncbi:MAG: PEP-CTERM sorting domain-containing protein [Fimbriimonadaceae bacterium]|nr:PEP-CTERM sorting domain-containing protein [Fimbriimonadaceae bacterium]QOJ13088.1 MAG: PEP-CTERM sorting domain-containing protein [Chthonomonadaceae bacterium]
MKAQTNPIYRVSCLWIAAAACSAAQATWIVTNLHPAGATSSRAFAVDGNHQVGDATFGSSRRATLWTGTASSSVDLHPGGATHSTAFAVYGNQQGGSSYSWPQERATLWTSTASSAVDMHPSWANSKDSVILGMSAGVQVGFAEVGILHHAALWTGTASSAIDLHPSDGVWSAAHGVWSGQQVGYYARISDGLSQASLWLGTAASLVVLNPAGSQNARAFGIQGGEQVGFAQLGGIEHAALWRGSASSFVDLHIAGKSYSYATGVYGGRQVGFTADHTGRQAALWDGTAASYFDLHSLLPSQYTWSEATGIYKDSTGTWISGWARIGSGNEEAFLWHEPVPEPATFAGLGLGVLTALRRRRARARLLSRSAHADPRPSIRARQAGVARSSCWGMSRAVASTRGLGVLCLSLLALCGSVQAQVIYNPSNDSYYELVETAKSWSNSRADADARSYLGRAGHLATLTSADENAFVMANFSMPFRTWIGGWQPEGDSDVNAPWEWVTGESFSFSNWGPGEPNGGLSENHLDILFNGNWNDEAGWIDNYFLVEYSAAVPEPATAGVLGVGLLAAAARRRKGA